jgi:spore coat polysaccharide biosynthesis protein SpsF
MNFGIIIQARTGSSRFPEKVLKKISNNVSVLEFQIKRLLNVFDKKQIFIATTKLKNDKKICDLAIKNGVNFYRGSKNNLIKRYLDCANKYKIKNIIRITSDCPLVDPFLIKKMIKIFLKNKIDYISNTLPIKLSTYPDGSDIEIFKSASLKKVNKLTKDKTNREHVTNYIWKNKDLFNCKTISLKKNLSKYRYCIDYESDLKVIREIIKILQKRNIFGNTFEVIKILNSNKEINKISKKNKVRFIKNRKDLFK